MKAMMSTIGLDCGPSRLPLKTLSDTAREAMRRDIESLGLMPDVTRA